MSHVDPDRKREYNRLYRILNRDMINEKKRLKRKRNKAPVEVEVKIILEDDVYECYTVLTEKVKQVGRTYDDKKLSYKALKYSPTGWVNASRFLPLEFDLCTIKTQKSKSPGWHTGGVWVGLKLKKNDKVIAWKLENTTCNKKTYKKAGSS